MTEFKSHKSRFGPNGPQEEEAFALEKARADVQHAIYSVMVIRDVNRTDLARRLGCTASNVTQILSDDGNPTIETLARIFHSLDDEFRISTLLLDEERTRAQSEEIHKSTELWTTFLDADQFVMDPITPWSGMEIVEWLQEDPKKTKHIRSSVTRITELLRIQDAEIEQEEAAISHDNEPSYNVANVA